MKHFKPHNKDVLQVNRNRQQKDNLIFKNENNIWRDTTPKKMKKWQKVHKKAFNYHYSLEKSKPKSK